MKKEFSNEQITAIAEICNSHFGNYYTISQNKNDNEEETQILMLYTEWIDGSTVTDLQKVVRFISIYPSNFRTLVIHLYQ